MICAMCGKDKRTVELQPSSKQLLFGGFNHFMELRCGKCETKVRKWIERMISNIEPPQPAHPSNLIGGCL